MKGVSDIVMRKKQSKTRTQKFKILALSILLAIIVWLLVVYINDPDITTTVSDLNVRFVGEMTLREKELAITGKSNMPSLSVTVTGKRSDLMNFMDDIYVEVDISDISAVGEYNLSGTISIPTTRITVEKENYSDIPVKIERLTSKEINVSVKQSGTVKGKLVQSVIDDPKVVITGVKSEIDSVSGAVATVDISDLRENNTERVNYLLTDSSGNLINSNETLESTRSYVDVINTLYDEKTLPVVPMLTPELDRNYILKDDKAVMTPSTVTVGVAPDNTDDKVVARIDKIEEGDTVVCMLEDSQGMYIPPESREVKVKAEIVKKSIALIEFEVNIENVPEGLSARAADKLTAQVWGEEGQINTENVYVTVDASGLGKGEYSLPASLNGDYAGFVGEYTVDVIIE